MLTSKSDSFLLRNETDVEVADTVDTESCDSVDPTVVSISSKDFGADLVSNDSDLSSAGSCNTINLQDSNSISSLPCNELVSRRTKS